MCLCRVLETNPLLRNGGPQAKPAKRGQSPFPHIGLHRRYWVYTTLPEFTARFSRSGIKCCSVFAEDQQAVIGRKLELMLQLHLLTGCQCIKRLQVTNSLPGVTRPQAAVELLVTGRGKPASFVEGSIKAEHAAG